jgi:hypothetical protein
MRYHKPTIFDNKKKYLWTSKIPKIPCYQVIWGICFGVVSFFVQYFFCCVVGCCVSLRDSEPIVMWYWWVLDRSVFGSIEFLGSWIFFCRRLLLMCWVSRWWLLVFGFKSQWSKYHLFWLIAQRCRSSFVEIVFFWCAFT